MTRTIRHYIGRVARRSHAQTARANLDEALGHLPPEIDGGTQE